VLQVGCFGSAAPNESAAWAVYRVRVPADSLIEP